MLRHETSYLLNPKITMKGREERRESEESAILDSFICVVVILSVQLWNRIRTERFSVKGKGP